MTARPAHKKRPTRTQPTVMVTRRHDQPYRWPPDRETEWYFYETTTAAYYQTHPTPSKETDD